MALYFFGCGFCLVTNPKGGWDENFHSTPWITLARIANPQATVIMQQTLFTPQLSTSPQILRYWLALWRTAKIGPAHFLKLLTIFPELAELFAASDKALSALGLSNEIIQSIKNPDWRSVDLDLRWAEGKNNQIITYHHPHYPQQLKQIAAAPPLLFIKGQVEPLQASQLAIVGSRNPTQMGIEHAQDFAQKLAQSGLVITSGLALGIDAAAHRGALQAGVPTIAVLGCSLDRIYPPSHTKLAEQISENGALVSEFPLGTRPRAEHFPQRNRIVSGLSLGVLVIEATLRSGSLITARLAGEQGRDVFAIPGSIHNPLSRGCHALIRQGAKLVETIADVLEELPQLIQADTSTSPGATPGKNLLAADHQQLLECVGFESTSVDLIIEKTGFTASKVLSLLSVLELQGQIIRDVTGYLRHE